MVLSLGEFAAIVNPRVRFYGWNLALICLQPLHDAYYCKDQVVAAHRPFQVQRYAVDCQSEDYQ